MVALRECEGELRLEGGSGVVVERIELLTCVVELEFGRFSGWGLCLETVVVDVPFSRCTRNTKSSTVILCPHIRSSGGHCRKSIDLVTNLATSRAAVRQIVTVGLPSASSAGTCALIDRQFMI